MKNLRTDMALEAMESLKSASGIAVEEERHGEIKLTRVSVEKGEGERLIGKSAGEYITLERDGLCEASKSERESFSQKAGRELAELLRRSDVPRDGKALVIGLGNRDITPDSLGPRVCEEVFVTRHIKTHLPKAIDASAGTVSAISPGVLGVTGLETGEVVSGVVRQTSPDVVIAVDALAARRTSRIAASLQMSNTGIAPGAGIGNMRRELTEETLGVPVIAIGIPMVVYAATVAADLLEDAYGEENADAEALAQGLLGAKGGELVVTPKNIDALSETAAQIIADVLNLALHSTMSRDKIREYMSR